MKAFYGACVLLGTVLPYSQLAVWLREHGLNAGGLVQAMFASPIAAFGWLDVVISGLVLVVFIVAEGRRLRMGGLWLPIVGTLAVGVSCGLPLFLLLRQRHLERSA